MENSFQTPDFRTLLNQKYGNVDSPGREAFHKAAARVALEWKIKNGSSAARLWAWCQRYLFLSWRRRAYLDRQLDPFRYRNQPYREMIGLTGTTITSLSLQGEVFVLNQAYTATSRSGYIDAGESVRVTDVVAHQLIVVRHHLPG
jgi:membrane protein implicated in regulation of membrane protease activity